MDSKRKAPAVETTAPAFGTLGRNRRIEMGGTVTPLSVKPVRSEESRLPSLSETGLLSRKSGPATDHLGENRANSSSMTKIPKNVITTLPLQKYQFYGLPEGHASASTMPWGYPMDAQPSPIPDAQYITYVPMVWRPCFENHAAETTPNGAPILYGPPLKVLPTRLPLNTPTYPYHRPHYQISQNVIPHYQVNRQQSTDSGSSLEALVAVAGDTHEFKENTGPGLQNERHSVTLSPIGRFVCSQIGCGKSFPSRSRLQRHILVHTGLKPFSCLYAGCNRKFSRRDNMLQHYRTHVVKVGPHQIDGSPTVSIEEQLLPENQGKLTTEGKRENLKEGKKRQITK